MHTIRPYRLNLGKYLGSMERSESASEPLLLALATMPWAGVAGPALAILLLLLLLTEKVLVLLLEFPLAGLAVLLLAAAGSGITDSCRVGGNWVLDWNSSHGCV